jgi:hypothetical protein
MPLTFQIRPLGSYPGHPASASSVAATAILNVRCVRILGMKTLGVPWLIGALSPAAIPITARLSSPSWDDGRGALTWPRVWTLQPLWPEWRRCSTTPLTTESLWLDWAAPHRSDYPVWAWLANGLTIGKSVIADGRHWLTFLRYHRPPEHEVLVRIES